jgi:hypothetical protein
MFLSFINTSSILLIDIPDFNADKVYAALSVAIKKPGVFGRLQMMNLSRKNDIHTITPFLFITCAGNKVHSPTLSTLMNAIATLGAVPFLNKLDITRNLI